MKMTSSATIEDYIQDLSTHAINLSGSVYTNNLVQVIKEEDGVNIELEHSFYSINSTGVFKKLGGITFTETGGEIGLSFDITNTEGVSEPVLGISTGGLEITGGSASFETSSIEVSDIDIVLASGAVTTDDINLGGIILGTVESGQVSILYAADDLSWTSNTGFNVQSGFGFTVNTDSVILNESGLTIDDIVLSQSGLQIGSEVVITSGSITLGTIDPVILDASGLSVGSDLSLTTSSGLLAGDISLSTSTGLVIGTGPTALVLGSSGLNIGADLSLDSTGLVIGDIQISVADGLLFDEVSLSNTALVFKSITGDVTLNEEGLSLGDDISFTKTDGLKFVDGFTELALDTTGLSIGTDLTLNTSGLQLGTDISLDNTGLFLDTIEFSVANGLVFDDVTLENTGLTFSSVTGDVVTDSEGILVGDDISLTKSGGLQLGTTASLDETSITFGTSPNETIVDDSSVQLGSDVLLNHDGLYIPNTAAAIYMGDTNQWKIVFDPVTQNLRFQFYEMGVYVTKAEMKST